MRYPHDGIVQGDIVDIPAHAFQNTSGYEHVLQLQVTDVYVMSTRPLMAVSGDDLVTGRQCTVWVDPSLVHVRLPPSRPRRGLAWAS